jgi:O-antigen ligase
VEDAHESGDLALLEPLEAIAPPNELPSSPALEHGSLPSLRVGSITEKHKGGPNRGPLSERLWLITLAGVLYAISMQKFLNRNALQGGTGAQGILEAACLIAGFLCVLLSTRKSNRRFGFSTVPLCFTVFGFFALCSSWRSFSPSLSIGKASLFLIMIATIYLVSQAGVVQDFFSAVYKASVAIVVAGLITGVLLPSVYPLISFDEYSGRTRLSVFATSAGGLGADITLLLLICPLLGGRIGWPSQVFLFVINVLSGGKTSTALICILLLVRFLLTVRNWRSWRGATIILASACLLAVSALSTTWLRQDNAVWTKPTEAIYGTQVKKEAATFNGRTDVWMMSIKLLPDAELLGYGFNGVRDLLIRAAAWAGNSHNGYLETALTGGLVGFSFLIFGVIVVGRACFRARPTLRVYLVSLFLGILILGAIGPAFSEPSYFGSLLLMWLYYEAERDRLDKSLSDGKNIY